MPYTTWRMCDLLANEQQAFFFVGYLIDSKLVILVLRVNAAIGLGFVELRDASIVARWTHSSPFGGWNW